MNVLQRTIACLAVLLALTACTPLASGTAGTSPADDEAGIRAAGQAWDSAYGALDTEALAAFYAPDAVLMPESTGVARGQPAIRDFLGVYVGLLAENGYKPAIGAAVVIEVSGNVGVRSGTYTVTDKSGTVVDTGKWVESWRRSDGKWQIARAIWNSDILPLFPPMVFDARRGGTG